MHPAHRTRTRARQLVVKPRALRSAGRQHAQNPHPVPQIDLNERAKLSFALEATLRGAQKQGKAGDYWLACLNLPYSSTHGDRWWVCSGRARANEDD